MYEKGSNRSDRNELYFLIGNYNNDSRGAEKFLQLFRPAAFFSAVVAITNFYAFPLGGKVSAKPTDLILT